MKIVIISHKECWQSPNSPSGYATIGGFPFQMEAISEIFDSTILVITRRRSLAPAGVLPIKGFNLDVRSLAEPIGSDFRRKLALLMWIPINLPKIWLYVQQADAVHALVPGDIGLLGLLVALAQHKPLFVRHCGTWGEPVTLADHFLLWLLERIAGGRNVVMATGGNATFPSQRNPDIQWIFSTTLTEGEWDSITPVQPWKTGQPVKLVTVGRLSIGKNTAELIRALGMVRREYPNIHLEILGDGPCFKELQKLSEELNLRDCITLHGNVSHRRVLETLSQSHLFVFPTRVKEGFPKAVLEAMACGLPIIATNVSVLPYLLGSGCGILLDETNANSIAKAILSALSDPSQLTVMGANARETSRQFTLEKWRELIRQRLQTRWGILRQDETLTNKEN
jgi:glycosyltransferase involved in cell wall biosynthesis